MKKYPQPVKETLEEAVDILKKIAQYRNTDDVGAWDNLSRTFIRGRLTTRTPSSSTDVTAGIDYVGDFCPTPTFLYILVNNSGTPVWRRITASSF